MNEPSAHTALQSLEQLLEGEILGSHEFDDLERQDHGPSTFQRGPEVPRIRPILVVLASRATGEQTDPDLQRAAELLHRALAVHDLALGREGGRRRRVARKIVKRSAEWLGGNHLTLRAIELAQAARPDVLGDLLGTLREFADGHALMAELQERVPTREDWLEHADTHTGALFAFCCRAGAKRTTERGVEAALGRYGRHLGRMWHIAEDVSLFSRPETEPAVLARALAGRPMLPVVRAIESSPSVGRLWTQVMKHPSEAGVNWLITLVDEAGGQAGAREQMVRESWQANKALSELPDSPARTALVRLASTVARANVPTR